MNRGEIHSEIAKERKIQRCLSCTCFVFRGSDIYFHYLESLDQLLTLPENSIKNIVYCSVQVVARRPRPPVDRGNQ